MIALDKDRQKVVLAGTVRAIEGGTVRVLGSHQREIELELPPGTNAKPGDELIFFLEAKKKEHTRRVIACYPADMPVDRFRRLALRLSEVLAKGEDS